MREDKNIPGVSGISLYVPHLRVRLQDWCEWTGNPWPKVEAVVGNSFRVCAPHESVYTMAANAVLQLIVDYDVDPQSVGFLGFGTESSTDNAAGAVIIKGMVDEALAQMGRAPLSRSCEVPEFKQACLGGIYALKGALRFLSCDGRGQRAIVVSGDVAEYERGSSGEQTQGAGAVAFLVESDPKLFAVDLARSGSAADYRGLDFRKPFARHFAPGYSGKTRRLHDFPVFNGRYSTTCYVDEVIHAMGALFGRTGAVPRRYYDEVAGIFFHRPYHRMPIQAFAALYVRGLAADPEGRRRLEALCREVEVDYVTVLEQIADSPRLFAMAMDRGVNADPTPEVSRVVDHFRRSPEFRRLVDEKMTLGSALVRHLGNLYTASLPAWIAAALVEARASGEELSGREFLTIGYGSGDAAEAIPIRIAPAWREAAARINFDGVLGDAQDLTREQYEALHDGRPIPGVNGVNKPGFWIERYGSTDEPQFQDIGIEYYRFNPRPPAA